jgi:hypothetical protein
LGDAIARRGTRAGGGQQEKETKGLCPKKYVRHFSLLVVLAMRTSTIPNKGEKHEADLYKKYVYPSYIF